MFYRRLEEILQLRTNAVLRRALRQWTFCPTERRRGRLTADPPWAVPIPSLRFCWRYLPWIDLRKRAQVRGMRALGCQPVTTYSLSGEHWCSPRRYSWYPLVICVRKCWLARAGFLLASAPRNSGPIFFLAPLYHGIFFALSTATDDGLVVVNRDNALYDEGGQIREAGSG